MSKTTDNLLPGFERPSRQKYMLDEAEARLIRQRRAREIAERRRQEFLKEIVVAVLHERRPRGRRFLHRKLSTRYTALTYDKLGELLEELRQEGKVVYKGRYSGWVKK